MRSSPSMYGNGPTFCQPACETRYVVRDTCGRPSEVPHLYAGWAARARILTAELRKLAAAPAGPASKTARQEPWRLAPMLPTKNSGCTWPEPSAPATKSPDIRVPESITGTLANNDITQASGAPKQPPPYDPNLWPTLDRILFPWEAPISPIEWAVANFLVHEHPAIHEQLVRVALEYAGLTVESDASDDSELPMVVERPDPAPHDNTKEK